MRIDGCVGGHYEGETNAFGLSCSSASLTEMHAFDVPRCWVSIKGGERLNEAEFKAL